jgi:FkbM family methyltransferase
VTIPASTYRRVVLDVGAHDGATTLPLAEADPATLVVAFEPTPDLADHLRERAAGLPNYRVVEAAVDEEEGTAQFNVAPVGTGSLRSMAFSDSRAGWLEGVAVTDRVEVNVVRLDSVLASLGIERVDYLHCDAQGNDLRVLRSLGEFLPAVERGVIEVPGRTQLYPEGHSRQQAVDFLLASGFRVVRVAASDVGAHEQNVFFKRAGHDGRLRRRLYYLWFVLLAHTASLWVVPAKVRVRLALRTRLAGFRAERRGER